MLANDCKPCYIRYDKDGYYSISEYKTGMMLDAASHDYLIKPRNVTVYHSNHTRQQLWSFRSAGENQFFIISKLNGYYLDLESGICENGHNVQMWSWANPAALNQKWSLEPVETEIKGDLNTDNTLSLLDLIVLQRHLVTLETISNEQFHLADMNADGNVDIYDLALLKHAVLTA